MNRADPVILRCEADLLALVPFTLGFVPEDSLVLVTLGHGPSPFHARVDLPDDAAVLDAVADRIVTAALRNGAETSFLVVYTDDECLAQRADEVFTRRLDEAGVALLASLRADGSRWYPLGADVYGPCAVEGVPYDITTHPLMSEAVLAGRVTYATRDELRESLEVADPDVVEEVGRRLDALPPLPPDRSQLVAEAEWAQETVALLLHGGVDAVSMCQERDLARLLRAVAHPQVREVVWCRMSRESSLAHVVLWREVVRRSPVSAVAPAAGLLAFAAWLAGNGALAWCAVDRALQADPRSPLARLVADVLEAAMPPSRWRPFPPESLALHSG